MSMQHGQFSFSADIQEEGTNVSMSMGSILLEAARRVDESPTDLPRP